MYFDIRSFVMNVLSNNITANQIVVLWVRYEDRDHTNSDFVHYLRDFFFNLMISIIPDWNWIRQSEGKTGESVRETAKRFPPLSFESRIG